MLGIGRRDFISVLGGAAAAWSLPAGAQQPNRMRRIGVLRAAIETDSRQQARLAALRQELAKLGWVEGRNLRSDVRASLDTDRLRSYAAELVSLKPDVILTFGIRGLVAAQQQTQTLPIVFSGTSDPVGQGFIASMTRPGGNITGFTNSEPSVAGKLVEALKQIAPRMDRVGMIFHPDNRNAPNYVRVVETAAAALALKLTVLRSRDAAEIEVAVNAFARAPNGGLVLPFDAVARSHRELIIELAARHGLPTIADSRQFVEAGGLMSYGIADQDTSLRMASYVDRILRGEKPGDLPVQAPTRFELIINLKAAKTLGLDPPISLLGRADELVE
jgi:putative ABC transport system substrate-binding protein